MAKNKGGRPALTKEQLNEIAQKLEPYLKAGLSIRKACREAQVPSSTVYEHIAINPEFADKINRFKQFLSVLLSNAMVKKLHDVIKKQQDEKELTKEEVNFLKWFALNSNITKEEFGERKDIKLFDPEVEIRRLADMIDEAVERDKPKKKKKEE